MQINLNIASKFIIIIGFYFLLQPGLDAAAQAQTNEPGGKAFKVSFLKPEIFAKSGDLSFNIIKVVNKADTATRFKPILILPPDWQLFSIPYNDTVVNAHDSVSLIYRFKLPDQVSSEVKYDVFFRAYSMKNDLLSENICQVFPETVHNWEITMPENRVFFYPRRDQASFSIRIENK